MLDSEHMLIIGTVWPEPDSSAAGSRMMQLIQLFLDHHCTVTFATTASKSSFSVELDSLGVTCAEIELNSSTFDDFIKKVNPTMVMFDRFMTEEQFGWRVEEHCPNAIRILDTEDLHCLRYARQHAWKEGRIFKSEDLLQEDIAKREIASIYRSDLSLIISEVECQLLTDLFRMDKSLIHYLPYLLDPIQSSQIEEWTSFEKRKDFTSIGNFLHEPNWNAVLFLKEVIWPLIRKQLPKVDLNIYGAYPSQKVFQLHNEQEGFLIKGRALNAADVLSESRVLVAPVRFGAGLKGKCIDAMYSGTPIVTTEIGAEGIAGQLKWPGFVEDNPKAFADLCVQLYKDEQKWNVAQSNCADIINTRFRKVELGSVLIRVLLDLKRNLKTHRKQNFIGSMLFHNTMSATRYMSKWIEEKNRVSTTSGTNNK